MHVVDFVIVVGGALGFALLMWLAYTGGRGYSVQDTQAHSSDYADEIKEGHGGMTALLWVSFAAVVAWTIFYFVTHAGEFSALSGG
jgi:hypothetical protein